MGYSYMHTTVLHTYTTLHTTVLHATGVVYAVYLFIRLINYR